MLHTKFRENQPALLEKKILKGFCHIWAWRPSWSCNPDATNNLSQGGATLNLALIGQSVLEKKIFEHCGRGRDDDGRTDSGP